jgi:predicted nucleic acid-binding protein
LVIDANILVSVAAGVNARRAFDELCRRSISLAAPEVQIAEAYRVVTAKIGLSEATIGPVFTEFRSRMRALASDEYSAFENQARARLHPRAQPDWPVLAAALAYDAAIWSNDRDFFGVGVPVWSSRNVRYAAGE